MENLPTMLPYKYLIPMSQMDNNLKQKTPRKEMRRRVKKMMARRCYNRNRIMKIYKSNAKKKGQLSSHAWSLMVA